MENGRESANPRDQVGSVAALAKGMGWAVERPFNIVEHERETVRGLYGWLSLAVQCQTRADSRGDRRTARKMAHAFANALMDLGESVTAVAAERDGIWGNNPIPIAVSVEHRWESVAGWVRDRQWEVAVNGSVLSTQRRAVRGVRALGRLLGAMARRDIHPPVARVREPVARSGRALASDGYGEDQKGSTWLTKECGVEREEERSESERDAGSPDPSRSRVRPEREVDGWDN